MSVCVEAFLAEISYEAMEIMGRVAQWRRRRGLMYLGDFLIEEMKTICWSG